jgi:hypothetical protein
MSAACGELQLLMDTVLVIQIGCLRVYCCEPVSKERQWKCLLRTVITTRE